MGDIQDAGASRIAQERDADEANTAEVLSAPSRTRRKTWIIRLSSRVVVLVLWEIVGRHALCSCPASAILRRY